MRIEELDRRLADACPVSDDELETWDLEQAETALIDEITASEPLAEVPATRSVRRPRWTASLSGGRLAAAAAGVAAAIAITFVGLGSLGGNDRPAYAAEAIRVAEANPRLLVTAPGWSVVRANQFSTDDGEIAFSDGEHELTMTWYAARFYNSYYRDRRHVDQTPTSVEVVGTQAPTFEYTESFATMLPPQGAVFVEIRADLPADEYREVLASVETTDVETWLGALPASVVQPPDRAAVVDAMLEDMPIPPDLDVEALRSEEAVLARYHLGARVSGAVACGWLDLWVKATDADDQATAREAAAALQTSRDWSILKEMRDQGGWSQAVWQYADDAAAGELERGVASTATTPGGQTYEFGPPYATGLACDSEFRRPRG